MDKLYIEIVTQKTLEIEHFLRINHLQGPCPLAKNI